MMDGMSEFDEKAAGWDTPERQERARSVAQAIRASVPLDPSMRAIDLGAGTGLLGIELAADVGEMVLAEPSAGMLEEARRKLAAGGPRNVSAIALDLRSAAVVGEPFDLAVSLLVLHHVEDTGAALGAVRRLLRTGGYIALADLDAEDGSFHDADAEGIHHHGFDRDELGRVAEAVGFADVAFTTPTVLERDGRRYPVFLVTARAV
jgi:ubiquinone/menaquinone biosynthesis C-methylase UbiE